MAQHDSNGDDFEILKGEEQERRNGEERRVGLEDTRINGIDRRIGSDRRNPEERRN